MRGIHRWSVNCAHKGPVTREMFPFDDIIMYIPPFSPFFSAKQRLQATSSSYVSKLWPYWAQVACFTLGTVMKYRKLTYKVKKNHRQLGVTLDPCFMISLNGYGLYPFHLSVWLCKWRVHISVWPIQMTASACSKQQMILGDLTVIRIAFFYLAFLFDHSGNAGSQMSIPHIPRPQSNTW